jgi:hypothetical protein
MRQSMLECGLPFDDSDSCDDFCDPSGVGPCPFVSNRWCRCAQPPATFCHPSGMKTLTSECPAPPCRTRR